MYRCIKQTGLNHWYDALCTGWFSSVLSLCKHILYTDRRLPVFFFKEVKIVIIFRIVFVYLFCFRFYITGSLSVLHFLFSAVIHFFTQGFIFIMPITCSDYMAAQRSFFSINVFSRKWKNSPENTLSLNTCPSMCIFWSRS